MLDSHLKKVFQSKVNNKIICFKISMKLIIVKINNNLIKIIQI